MKIAQVSPYDIRSPGGVQAQVRGLAAALSDRGHAVDVIGPGAAGWEWLGPIVGIPSNGAVARVAIDPRVARRMSGHLRSYDVVHVHEPVMPMVGLAATRVDRPVVGTLHADPSRMARRLLALGYGRRALDRCGALVAVSPTAASAIPSREVTIIPNGVEDELFQPTDKDPHLVVFVGRDEPRKGLDVLLDAWPAVNGEAELAVISDRVEGPAGVRWLGQVADDERRQWMRRATVVVAPNVRGESFGMVVAEGLAAGAAVVASDLPAFRWVAGDGADYVAPNDSAALAQALADRLVRPVGSIQQRRRADRFRWAGIAAGYEDLYAAVG